MNKVLSLLLISSLFLFGCVSSDSQPASDAGLVSPLPSPQVDVQPMNGSGQNIETPQSDVVVQDSPSVNDSEVSADNNSMVAVQEFSLTAKTWEFTPSSITVRKDIPVKLRVTSIDVEHGFSISEFNVNSRLQPGQETVVEFTPDRTGSFSFFCSVFCGSGHGGMRGTLVVTD
ncbi:MAG: cupredoxin domain-containing protein [Candidatus Micrarchaeota archaeon]|nr:cupredoxin domain-containing protein [Candidatus Micrarchaeota archaeon]